MVHDDDRADVDPIAVVQHHHAAQWRISHPCTILAAQIFDLSPLVADNNPRVMPRDSRDIQADGRRWIPADAVFAVGQRDATAARHNPPTRSRAPRYGAVNLRGEGVADAMCRSNDRRARLTIVECPPQLFDEPYERRVRHECPGPEPFVQFGFSHDARCLVDQQGEQIERLRRQMNCVTIASELAPP
jgi:hypothetical protein